MSEPLPDIFHTMVSTAIDAEGVYPHQALVRNHQGGLTVLALDLDPVQLMRLMMQKALEAETAELIFGMDRFTQPGQGTEFDDVVAAAWYRKGQGWTVGVINYQDEPRIVRPWDWDNVWWTGGVTRELIQMGAPELVVGRA